MIGTDLWIWARCLPRRIGDETSPENTIYIDDNTLIPDGSFVEFN